MSQLPDPLTHRVADHDVERLFLKRWSPRAMSGEAVDQDVLNRLLEAARWAPSTYNEQEWRFVYARRDTDHWSKLFELLVEANQAWCQQAGALIVVFSRTTFTRNGKPNPVHEFDAGLAVQNLLLQAAAMDVVAHPMAGFNRDLARRALGVPDGFESHCMIAIGQPGDPDQLPESMRELEQPTSRKPIDQIACEGGFRFKE